MAKIYRLLSGKISRPNASGVQETHRAPYDFIPLESELTANKWRMRFIREVPDPEPLAAPIVVEQPAIIPANTPKVIFLPDNNIQNVSVRVAVDYVNSTQTEDELDRIMLQELDNQPKTRRLVMKAIEYRRTEIAAKTTPEELVSKAIAGAENTAEKADSGD